MPSSQAVAKKGDQRVVQPAVAADQEGILEEREASAKASASAGLNLNIFAAFNGAFSGKSRKETQADGSSVEDREEQARIQGVGVANLNAVAAAKAEQKSREKRAAIEGS